MHLVVRPVLLLSRVTVALVTGLPGDRYSQRWVRDQSPGPQQALQLGVHTETGTEQSCVAEYPLLFHHFFRGSPIAALELQGSLFLSFVIVSSCCSLPHFLNFSRLKEQCGTDACHTSFISKVTKTFGDLKNKEVQ